MTWAKAHAAAMIAAAQAHSDLEVARGGYVDVFAALSSGGITVMGQRLGQLFGAYFGPEAHGPAVLLNSEFDETAMRHTAAHELGHHRFRHGTKTDEHLDALEAWGQRHWPEPEMQAEAFAAWFLMPLSTVNQAMAAIGLSCVSRPDEAYQLSLWLGTSFRGTVRHLVHLKKISSRQAEAWSAVSPSELRRPLDHGTWRPSGRHWDLGLTASGRDLHVRAGDRLTIRLDGAAQGMTGSLPEGVALSTPSGRGAQRPRPGFVVLELDRALRSPTDLTVGDSWTVALIPAPTRHGHIDGWD